MDQRPIKNRANYLRFEKAVLDKDVAVAGPVGGAHRGASRNGPTPPPKAKLVDVWLDENEALVLDAPIRARYRYGHVPDDAGMVDPG